VGDPRSAQGLPLEQFALVCGADLVYSPSQVPGLVAIVRQLCISGRAASVVIWHRTRRVELDVLLWEAMECAGCVVVCPLRVNMVGRKAKDYCRNVVVYEVTIGGMSPCSLTRAPGPVLPTPL
jgi:hypothetical protein